MRFCKTQRLTKSAEYAYAHKAGKLIDCGAFLLRIAPHPLNQCSSTSRLGIIASRKVGNAVKRNRAKRVFRAIFRSLNDTIPHHCDIVVIVRHHFDQYAFQKLRQRFESACRQYIKD